MGQVIRKVSRAGKFIGWYIRYVDSDGKRTAKATKATSAAEARRILVELEAAAGRRQLGVPDRPQPVKGTTLIARWLDEYQPRTINRDAWVQRQKHSVARAMPHLNRIVTRPDAAQIARKLGGEMAPGTLRLAITALKSAWRWAVVENIVEINPWLAQRLPQVDMRVEYLSRDAVGRLIAAADADKYRHGPVLAVAIRLAVYAGLRASEAWGLMWSSVDFDRNVITIKNGYRDAPTKSRRDRVIPIADQLYAVLSDWRQRCPSQDHVCPVFSSAAGKWIACRRRPIIDRLYRTAGLPVPRAPWHVLRHTFASHFLMSGGSLLTLQRILGHTTIAVTQIYSHLSDEHVATEMKRLKL